MIRFGPPSSPRSTRWPPLRRPRTHRTDNALHFLCLPPLLHVAVRIPLLLLKCFLGPLVRPSQPALMSTRIISLIPLQQLLSPLHSPSSCPCNAVISGLPHVKAFATSNPPASTAFMTVTTVSIHNFRSSHETGTGQMLCDTAACQTLYRQMSAPNMRRFLRHSSAPPPRSRCLQCRPSPRARDGPPPPSFKLAIVQATGLA